MIAIAICDDDQTILQQTLKLVKEYPIPFQIDVFSSGSALLESQKNYEIILLDIDMPDLNGLETAQEIRKRDKNVKLIYVTNYSDYTTFAFGVHAFAYLLKPLSKATLYQQLDEAFQYMQQKTSKILELETESGIVRLEQNEINYFEYQSRKVLLHTKDKMYVLRTRITELSRQLENSGFAMPHKSFIVNLYAVKRIQGYDIILTDQTVIPLSQKKSTDFRKRLNEYLSKNSMGINNTKVTRGGHSI